MNKKYLHKVIDQLISETEIDKQPLMDKQKEYVDKVVDRIVSETQISKRKAQSYILTPFSERVFSAHEFSEGKDLNTRYSSVSALTHYFSLYAEDVYALDIIEIGYALKKYRNIIMLTINGVIK